MTGEAEPRRRNVTLLIGAGAAALGAIIIAMVVMMVVGMGGHMGTGPGTDATPVVVTGDRAGVRVVDNAFEPSVIQVDTGATVAWTWDGNLPHNVRGDGFESDTQDEGTFEFTFADAGEYNYECTVHPGMDGRVIVATP